MTKLLEKKHYPQVKVLESWPGGPLAEFAPERPRAGWGIPYDPTSWKGNPAEQAKRVYKGTLICGRCRKPTQGLYQPNSTSRTWDCEACRAELNPPKPKKGRV